MLALSVCFTQTSWSAGRIFAMSKSRLLYSYRRIVWFPQHRIRRNTLCTGFQSTNVCSRNAQPLLKCAAWIVTFTNQPCLTYEWLVSHTWLDSHMTWLTRDMTHLRMSFDPFVHVTIHVMHIQDSCEKSKQFLLSLSVVNTGNWLLVWFQIISLLTCNFKWYLQAPQFGNSTPPPPLPILHVDFLFL